MKKLTDLLQEKILVLDGAMGTSIQNYNLEEDDFRGEKFKDSSKKLKGANELLNFTKPNIIREIYRSYIEAGADIIETNTFNGNSISMEDYNLGNLAYEVSLEGTKLAKLEVEEYYKKNGKQVFIAGSIGPSNKSISIDSSEVGFDKLKEAYKSQIRGIIHGGGDILLIETIFDGLNAKATVVAAEEVFEEENKKLPIMISVTVDKFGRLLSGQTMESLVVALDRDSIISFGLNCSFGAKDLIPLIKKLGKITNKAISIYPNAGLPNQLGEYEEKPEETVGILKEIIDNQEINIVGGCCGTTPEHIRLIALASQGKTPRPIKESEIKFSVSGNEILKNKEFLVIGERNNVAGSRKFARLIKEKKYDEALEISRNQVIAGADILDLNLDDGMIESKIEMEKYIKLLLTSTETANVPVMIDSSDFDIIEIGLKNLPGKGIVNSISLKEGEKSFLDKAKIVQKYGAALVVMAFDEQGQATTFERKIEIAKRSYDLLVGINFSPADIIFDTNILTIGTGEESDRNYAKDYIKSIKWIKENLPYAKTSGGLSNVSFAFRGNNPLRHAMHKIFLDLCKESGLDMVIMNPAEKFEEMKPSLEKKLYSLILNTDDVLEALLEEQIEKIELPKTTSKKIDPKDQIINNLVNGNKLNLTNLIDELLKKYSPLEIIQDIMMEGMEKVGHFFNTGKLFLPQVVKSAVIMKEAVNYLTPLLKDETSDVKNKGTIVMATVDGDVHDIGKNIVKTVLECNGYKIIDLGVMTPLETIIQTIKENKVDGVTLSGLITPSLNEMIKVAKAIEENGFDIPVFIGGAATSCLHTAMKIEPKYPKNVYHLTDASNTVIVLDKILGGDIEYKKNVFKLYKTLRNSYEQTENKREYLGIKEAYEKRKVIKHEVKIPSKLGVFDINPTMADVEDNIDWNIFLHDWKVKGTSEEKKTLEEGKKYLQILKERKIKIFGRYGIFKCRKDTRDIITINDAKFPMVRTQHGEETISLTDFLDEKDYIGAFVVSVEEVVGNSEYENIMFNLLGNRITEASANYLQGEVDNISKVKIRPAIGYPILPDHSLKKEAFDLLNIWDTGIKLSSNYTMDPIHSVCGLLFFNKDSEYFDLGKINFEQIEFLAKNRGVSPKEMKERLGVSVY